MKLFLMVLLLISDLVAAPGPEVGAEQRQAPAQQPSKPVAENPPPAIKPVKKYTPSEKVGADSAVSFPVDI